MKLHWSDESAYFRLGRTGVDWACAIPGCRAHLTFWLFGRFLGRLFLGRASVAA